MADSKVFLAKGAKLRCEKSKGSTVELQSEDRGFSFNGVYFATNQDKIGVKHIPLFDHCQWNEDKIGQDICTVGAVRWYVTKDDTSLGEELELLTLDSFAVCGQALAKIKPDSNGQGLITVEEADWVKIIQEKLRSLEAEYIKEMNANLRSKTEIRAEFREKYMQIIKQAFEFDSPGAYDRLMKGIEDHCNEMRTEYWDKGKDATKNMKEEEKERFAKLALEFAKLQEKYTDIPWQVLFAQTCCESGYGGSKYACTVNDNEDDEIGFGRLYNNLFGELVPAAAGTQVAVNFDSYEKAIGNYLLKFRTHGVTEVGGTGVFTDLFEHDYRKDPDAYKDWYYDLANGTKSEREKENPTAYCMIRGLNIPDPRYEGALITVLEYWDERGLYKIVVLP